MFDNLINSLRPHAQHIGTLADQRFQVLLNTLNNIRWAIENDYQRANPTETFRRASFINATPANPYVLDRVPPGEIWEVNAVSARAAWELQLGGVLFLSSTNNVLGGPAIILPGEVLSFVPNAPTDGMILLKRITDRPDPVPDRGYGRPELIGVPSTPHEVERDLIPSLAQHPDS